MFRLLIVSKTHGVLPETLADIAESVSSMQPSEIASVGQLEDVDVVLILGALESVQQAQQLGGVISLAVPGGLFVISAPGTVAGQPEKALLRQLIPDIPIGDAGSICHLQNPHPDFADFVRVFGFGQTFVHDYPADLEILGWLLHGGTSYPGGFFLPVEQGGIYYMPFQYVGDHHSMLSSLLQAVRTHMERTSVRLPDFVEQLRLPGEHELERDIEEAAGRLRELEDERERLRGFHGLLGSASGNRFEDLCIMALNMILQDSPYTAEDKPETFDEDFWIVRNSEDHALVEAKGVGSNVRRQHVNQVDNHREAYGMSPQNLPGVLIVNIFRNSDQLETRQTGIAADVISAAVRQNVLILRSWDLHQLLGRALKGEDVASEFVKQMAAGGGWLKADKIGVELVS